MSLVKDIIEDAYGYGTVAKIKSVFDFKNHARLASYRKQRADRGWADSDAWNMGDHIAKITAEMLVKLDESGITDYKWLFKFFKEEGTDFGYKNLKQVYTDIQKYQTYEETSWTDDLSFDFHSLKHDFVNGVYTTSETPQQKKEIIKAIKKWHDKEKVLRLKAENAMQFFGRNYVNFWD